MNIESKPTGSITDKLFSILEGAAVLVKTTKKIEDKLGKRTTVMMARHEIILVTKQLREGATMIDNLLSIIEQREMVKLDKIGNPVVRRELTKPTR